MRFIGIKSYVVLNVARVFRFTALAEGSLTYVGMIQDLHYSDFSEELKSTKSQIVFFRFEFFYISNVMKRCLGQFVFQKVD